MNSVNYVMTKSVNQTTSHKSVDKKGNGKFQNALQDSIHKVQSGANGKKHETTSMKPNVAKNDSQILQEEQSSTGNLASGVMNNAMGMESQTLMQMIGFTAMQPQAVMQGATLEANLGMNGGQAIDTISANPFQQLTAAQTTDGATLQKPTVGNETTFPLKTETEVGANQMGAESTATTGSEKTSTSTEKVAITGEQKTATTRNENPILQNTVQEKSNATLNQTQDAHLAGQLGTSMKPVNSLDLSKVQIKVGDGTNVNPSTLPNQIADKILHEVKNGNHEFNVQLYPKELGKIGIKLVFEGNVAQLFVSCSNPKTQSLLAMHTDQLKNILESNTNMQTAVSVQDENGLLQQQHRDSYDGRGERQGRYQQQQNQSNSSRQNQEAISFLNQLKFGLLDDNATIQANRSTV